MIRGLHLILISKRYFRYADGRGSSHQQQVSCYTYKDVNNWWIIKRPNNEDLAVEELYDSIKHEDIIHLFKKGTRCSTRDIFSTLLFNHQRLYKAYRAIALFSHKIPDKIFYEEFSLSVSSIQIPHNAVEPLNGPDAAHLLADMELGSKSNKFTEFQFKMLITNQKNAQNYNSAGDPAEWPFLTRGIAYYITKDSSNQAHLMGNILVWYTASLCLLLYSCLLVFYLLRRRRLCYDIDEAEVQRFCTAGEVLLTGYLLHFLPSFFYDRTLFLHHYLPAYLFKLMLAGYFVTHVHYLMAKFTGNKLANSIFSLGVFVWSLGAVYVFIQFSGLSYAHRALSSDDVSRLNPI